MTCLRIFLSFNWACVCCLALLSNAYYNNEDLATDLIIVAVFFAGELLLIAEYTHNWLGFEKRSEPIQMVYVHRHYDPVPPL